MKILKVAFIIFCLLTLQSIAVAQTVADNLILNDIGTYRISRPQAFFEGRPPIGGPRVNQNDSGVLSGTDHFQDHADTTYKVMYIDNSGVKPSPEVEVTQHTGGDSDRWLLHEVDKGFRTSLGIPGGAYWQRIINGQSILESGAGGRIYRWINGNTIINIEYSDAQMTKSEPLEVVQAYLAKYPSTIVSMTLKQLRNDENVIKWIKDEIDRRLWLCDKWNAQYQAGSIAQDKLMVKLLSNMNVFLKYRARYFKIAADDDKDLLDTYHNNNDLTSIQTKLKEYKTWWSVNKGKSITLP